MQTAPMLSYVGPEVDRELDDRPRIRVKVRELVVLAPRNKRRSPQT